MQRYTHGQVHVYSKSAQITGGPSIGGTAQRAVRTSGRFLLTGGLNLLYQWDEYLSMPRFQRWGIDRMMYVSVVLMILLPVFLITYLSATSYHSILMETITSRATTTLELVSASVDNDIGRIKKTITSILDDREVSASGFVSIAADGDKRVGG